jgi:cobalt-zinc-cadmium efflux system membrane fusion protein
MSSSHSWFGALAALALASSAVWIAVRTDTGSNRPALVSAQAIEAKALRWKSLQVEPAEPAEQLWTDAFPGALQLDESNVARVGVPLAGHVGRVYAQLGSQVEKGAPLFSMTSPDLASLGLARRQAALAYESAQESLARIKGLSSARVLSERELQALTQQRRQAELSLQVARSRQHSLDLLLTSGRDVIVRAPRAGRVVESQLSVGQQLSAQSEYTVLTIADLSSLWFVAELFETDLPGIAPGSVVSLTLPARPELILSGEVDAISSVDPERRSAPVRVRLDNAAAQLKVNMFARARFLTTPPVGSVSVASSALRSDGSGEYVYVRAADGRFERRAVRSGSVVAGRRLIHDGLRPGDEVAIRGMTLLDNRLARLL